MTLREHLLTLAIKHMPHRMVKHYIYPLLVSGKRENYNSQDFFNSCYGCNLDEFSDRITISRNYDEITTKFHYNSVENSIIKALKLSKIQIDTPVVLDVGSGAGHWIDFYMNYFKASNIIGVDISNIAADELKKKYEFYKNVEIYQGDISKDSFELPMQFDLINAIGILFHIVDDLDWEKAIRKLSKLLKANGIMVIGGNFNKLTQNVEFHRRDNFSNWNEKNIKSISDNNRVLITKRIRSLDLWKRVAKENGLEYIVMQKTDSIKGTVLPENNILILRKNK